MTRRRRVSNAQRWIDRYIGVPLLIPFALIPKRPLPSPDAVRRIGVLKSGAIGDTLLLVGIFESLRVAYPRAELILITGTDNAGAARLFQNAIDRHEVIDVRAPLLAVRRIRALELDVMIDAGPWPRFDAIVTALSGARHRVGFQTAGQQRHFAYDRVVVHSSELHQLENFRNLARAVGASSFGATALTPPRILDPSRVPTGPFVVFHPWSGGQMGTVKEWAADRWVALAERLAKSHGFSILVSGGSGDAEGSSELVQAMGARGVNASSIAGQYSIGELADLIVAGRGVISVNSGVMHLAALLGAPVVSLEGPVPVRRWGPVGPRATSVVSTLPGSGYLDLGFEYEGQRHDCMEGVSVDAVAAAVSELFIL